MAACSIDLSARHLQVCANKLNWVSYNITCDLHHRWTLLAWVLYKDMKGNLIFVDANCRHVK